ncbi:MAG: hypothetical protein QNK23_03850 [Crocinitomicaceae bacterium]|nr:hypothetical protein [Crocinitomicaceae bacterium]
MKKLVYLGVLGILGVIALSSCRKDYECVDSAGYVYSECIDCKSSGLIKTSFDSSCALYGGTVQVK